MTTYLIASISLNLVLAYACWKLKKPRTLKEAVKVVIQGGGGPGSTDD